MRAPVLVCLLLAAGPALAQTPPRGTSGGTEEFGPWLLSCSSDRMTDRSECRLLHREPVEPASAGQAALALEVMERDGALVPVVTARNLTLDGLGRGLLAFTGTAQLRFPPNRLFEMPCGLEGRSVICAPRAKDAARAAAELPGADRVLVRVVGLLPDGQERAEPAELRLSRTAEALARARARAPAGSMAAPPAPGGFELRELIARLLRFFSE
ncbi:hypothetical protein [Roseomonas sp. BN140053]|uniref:hypothetical protein n=1 Tax=Roseomonas sp. BN140053 TaxID=3391898 RepID=UPI0039ED07DE